LALELEKVNIKLFKEFSIKLIEYLNNNVYIPISFKLRKLNLKITHKNVFIF
jgi:hypothetical protein